MNKIVSMQKIDSINNLNLTENLSCSYNYYNYSKGKSEIITFTPKNNKRAFKWYDVKGFTW